MQEFTHSGDACGFIIEIFFPAQCQSGSIGILDYNRYWSTTRQSFTFLVAELFEKRALSSPIHHVDGRAESQYFSKA